MTKKLTFLGIETSCDETAAAVIGENDNGTADIMAYDNDQDGSWDRYEKIS